MYIDQTWDYPAMATCANKLDELRDASNSNKIAMDNAFESLAAGVQADVGKAFLASYSEHSSTIQYFAQVLNSEAELLRNNSNRMQAADAEIAAQVRQLFAR